MPATTANLTWKIDSGTATVTDITSVFDGTGTTDTGWEQAFVGDSITNCLTH